MRRTVLLMLVTTLASAILVFAQDDSLAQPNYCTIGQVRLLSETTADPNQWLRANGQILSISWYQPLFHVIGTTYGGDGQLTFRLPNLEDPDPGSGEHYYICAWGVLPHSPSGGAGDGSAGASSEDGTSIDSDSDGDPDTAAQPDV